VSAAAAAALFHNSAAKVDELLISAGLLDRQLLAVYLSAALQQIVQRSDGELRRGEHVVEAADSERELVDNERLDASLVVVVELLCFLAVHCLLFLFLRGRHVRCWYFFHVCLASVVIVTTVRDVTFMQFFLPHDAIHKRGTIASCRTVSVSLSDCPSHSCIMSKRIKISANFFSAW